LRRSSIVISSPAATAPSSVTFSFEGTVAAPVTFYVSEYGIWKSAQSFAILRRRGEVAERLKAALSKSVR
jgi:hypothetical protein